MRSMIWPAISTISASSFSSGMQSKRLKAAQCTAVNRARSRIQSTRRAAFPDAKVVESWWVARRERLVGRLVNLVPVVRRIAHEVWSGWTRLAIGGGIVGSDLDARLKCRGRPTALGRVLYASARHCAEGTRKLNRLFRVARSLKPVAEKGHTCSAGRSRPRHLACCR